MLHAPISDIKKPTASFNPPSSLRSQPEKERPHDCLPAQSVYGNQAVLRSLRGQSGRAEGLVQRKPDCACGGGCGGCRQKSRSAGTQSSPVAALAHTSQVATPETPATEYSPEGVLMTLDGSGTCQNGGAKSVCIPSTGAYKITENQNTCCTSNCSINHEITHASDASNWGCCKALSVAYNAAKTLAEKNAAVTKYNDWMHSGALDLTECHAYSNDVVCANEMAVQKNCNGAGRDTDCCKDIAEYKEKYSAKAKEHCDVAPKEAPPCPVF